MLYATSVYHLYTKTYLFFFIIILFLMIENSLYVSGEPSSWQITQAIRYYTSACLKALKYWWFSAFFCMCKTPIPYAQNNNTTLLITFYSCVSVN